MLMAHDFVTDKRQLVRRCYGKPGRLFKMHLLFSYQEVLCLLLDYQAKVEQLFHASGDVVPLRLRKDPVE